MECVLQFNLVFNADVKVEMRFGNSGYSSPGPSSGVKSGVSLTDSS